MAWAQAQAETNKVLGPERASPLISTVGGVYDLLEERSA